MTAKSITAAIAAAFALALGAAAPALAQEQITSFETSSSDSRAGRPPRPDDEIHPRRTRCRRGRDERHLQRARGGLRKHQRGHQLHPVRLRPRQMPAQLAGRADHRPRQLLGRPELPARHRAALRRLAAGGPDGADRVQRPDPRHPDLDPGHGANGDRLRAALQGLRHHPADAARERQPDHLGLPGERTPQRRALPGRLPGKTGGLPGVGGCIVQLDADETEHPEPAVHRQPDPLQRRAPGDRTPGRDLPGPGQFLAKPRAPIRKSKNASGRRSSRFSRAVRRPTRPTPRQAWT